MTLKNGETANVDEVLNLVGTQFKNQAQLLYNSAYIGFNSKLNVTGVPNLKNIKYDVFNTDTATTKIGIVYNSTDKLYQTLKNSDITYYAIVEAASFSGTTGLSNGVMQIGTGKWLIFDPTASSDSQELERAKVHQILWSTGVMAQFTSITAFKVSDSTDVGYRGYRIIASGSRASGLGGSASVTGNFGTTSGNTASTWSNLFYSVTGVGESTGNQSFSWQVPNATTLNIVSISASSGSTSTGTSNEIGTDLQADEKTNPSTYTLTTTSYKNWSCSATVIIFTKGTLSATAGGDMSLTFKDYYTTHSVPETTLAGSLDEETGDVSLIFQTTSLPTITECIPTWNSSIDGDNTLTVSISADGTNYEEVTDATIHRFTNTGTNLFIKFEIDRVDTSAVDKISEYAVLYNITGE